MHLADSFIQSDLQYKGYTFFVSMCSLGIEPTTFALLTQSSTTEPQEHLKHLNIGNHFPNAANTFCKNWLNNIYHFLV